MSEPPQVEIVVPVKNEEDDLAPGITRLAGYLADTFPFSVRVTIADNGSTDSTWPEARALAERAGLRIHEVPVDWVDDPDSRVGIAATALGDLRGIARVGYGLARGAIRVPRLRSAVPAPRSAADLARPSAGSTSVGSAR